MSLIKAFGRSSLPPDVQRQIKEAFGITEGTNNMAQEQRQAAGNNEFRQETGGHKPPLPEGRKLGEGALAAAWRQGLGEIGQALKAFPDSIQVIEAGQLGTATPATVYAQQGMHKQEARDDALRGLAAGQVGINAAGVQHSEPLTPRQQKQEANARAADAAKANRSVSLQSPQQGRNPERGR
jgi:hypothetical protein